MGQVYRARDPRLRRDVAVKVLIGGAAASPDQLRRFEDEARAAGALNHPNVLSVFDVGSEGGSPYVVFELLEGSSLRDRLRQGPLPPRKAVEYAVQACHGLAAAHARGIVHRDLKPGNLFVTADGRVKILDFGLAKLAEGMGPGEPLSSVATRTATHPGLVVGTLAYMSPEQVQGAPADARSDLFALGATLYEMLSGRPAFVRATAAETMSAILSHDPEPLSGTMEGLSLPALDAIVRRCLEKSPEERFQSARDLAFALGALSDAIPAARGTESSRTRGKRWLLVSTGAALAVLVGLGLFHSLRGRSPTPPGPLTVVPFTSFPGQELAPTFSPDGSQIAFAWSPEGAEDRFDLYVKVIGSEKPLRLTEQPATGLYPAWSPDGRQIAFSRWGKPGSGVYLVPALGGGERRIADTNISYFLEGLLSWSPDAKLLAYSTDGSLFLLDVATLEKRELPRPAKDCQEVWVPAFSPDGRSLAFACMVSIDVNRVYVSSVSGANTRQIALVQGEFTGLAWSGDGKHVIFAHDGNLWRVGASGGALEELLSGRDASLPAVSPGGQRLAYSQWIQNINIWRLPLDGSGRAAGAPTKLVSSSRSQRNPAFSPDGRRLAFDSDRSGTSEIWISAADGSDPQRLTSFGGPFTGSPRWSPDGKRIAFDSRASGESGVYVVGADGGVPKRIATGVTDSEVPTWSRDGQWLYFGALRQGTGQIFKVRAEGGPPVQLTEDGGALPQEAADGRRVYFTRDTDRDGQIWSVSASGGDERPVTGMPRVAAEWGTEWTVTSSGIYFVQGEPPAAVAFLDFATGKVRRVAGIPGKPSPWDSRLALSPDGRTLLFAQIDGIASDIMLVEGLH
jgi:Tol biopolymer transport system component/serine/threonine protein kinase